MAQLACSSLAHRQRPKSVRCSLTTLLTPQACRPAARTFSWNLARVAQLMVECAAGREESRGLHYNSDYPEKAATGRDSILIPPHFDIETALTGATDQLPPYTG